MWTEVVTGIIVSIVMFGATFVASWVIFKFILFIIGRFI